MIYIGICWIFSTPINVYAQQTTPLELPNTLFCDINATIIENDSSCKVEWSNPWYWYWDDGSCDEHLAWLVPTGEAVNKFELPAGPVQIIGAEINVGDGTYPIGGTFLDTEFLLVIYDNDGEGGMPGTMLDSVFITVENYDWILREGLNVLDEDGIFYIGMRQLLFPPNVAPTGVDSEIPSMNKSYIRQPYTGQWLLSSVQDFMIRAYTCSTGKQVITTSPKSIENIVVSRISDFNPAQGETPEDGVLTVIDSVFGMPTVYFDTAVVSLVDGYYAYGLKRFNEEDSTYSGWSYSNPVYHILTSVDDVISNGSFSIYPNPSHDKVVVCAKLGVNQTIQVIDITGRFVFRSDLPISGEMTIDVSDWTRGLYLVNISNQGWSNNPVKLVVD